MTECRTGSEQRSVADQRKKKNLYIYLQIHSAQMFLWEEQRSVWHITEVVSAETHLHGDNLGILTREDRLETQPRGKMRSERKLACDGKRCVCVCLPVSGGAPRTQCSVCPPFPSAAQE